MTRFLNRLAPCLLLAAIPLVWGGLAVALGDGGGWVLVAFGVAVGVWEWRQE